MPQILVPFDHSDNAFIALQQALLIAEHNGSDVELLHVVNMLIGSTTPMIWSEEDLKDIEKSLFQKVDNAKSSLHLGKDINVKVKIKKGDRIVDEVIKEAEETDTILIVMGTHGMTGIVEKVLGTNSLDVLKESKWPVLLIPTHWSARKLDEMIVATLYSELDGIYDSVISIQEFLRLPVRAVQLVTVVDTVDQKDKVVKGIPFKYVESKLDYSLAQGLRAYTESFRNSILVMHVQPRNFLQKIFQKSFTEDTARVIEIPLLSIKK
ncbi:MAG: universal stress protein [Chitinophagales bacterium]|nr:universal stress protein [Chitinophagales bacterium]